VGILDYLYEAGPCVLRRPVSAMGVFATLVQTRSMFNSGTEVTIPRTLMARVGLYWRCCCISIMLYTPFSLCWRASILVGWKLRGLENAMSLLRTSYHEAK
jgi:hypothetical protein